ncbi:GNAT family N-acetyltransferase [Actinoplanes sp. NPDC049596]|uniref:GNAT family N-acetyltransferase n=1 Tax=unclassified Actinoplanes TaxID=2626549 RepID=UPI00341BA0FC
MARNDTLLDNVIWHSLLGPLGRLGEVHGRAGRFLPEVLPLWALDDPTDPDSWNALAKISEVGQALALGARSVAPPPDWTRLNEARVAQMVDAGVEGMADPQVEVLGSRDLPAMVELLHLSPPGGPFEKRTHEMGSYLGLRDGGRLVAMAGERFRVDGWTEISSVTTHPGFRRRGLATRLVQTLVESIHARGELAFLHTSNEHARRLYEQMGFTVRTSMILGFYAHAGESTLAECAASH